MVWLLRKCIKCGEYTLKKRLCPYCNGEVRIPHPAKFSPDDKYAIYKSALRSWSYEKDDDSGERKG